MRYLIMTIALLALVGSPLAIAQSGSSSSSSGSTRSQETHEAPIGHRQPRSSVPSDKNVSDAAYPIDKETVELNRKLKSICRGC